MSSPLSLQCQCGRVHYPRQSLFICPRGGGTYRLYKNVSGHLLKAGQVVTAKDVRVIPDDTSEVK